jgi:hypothetical protein
MFRSAEGEEGEEVVLVVVEQQQLSFFENSPRRLVHTLTRIRANIELCVMKTIK